MAPSQSTLIQATIILTIIRNYDRPEPSLHNTEPGTSHTARTRHGCAAAAIMSVYAQVISLDEDEKSPTSKVDEK